MGEPLVAEIREEVRAVIREELSRFLMEIKPFVSDSEEKEIEESIGKPRDYRKDEFVEVDL
ncbi:MAG: hypothetical protein GXN93_01030 [Candidatus Diapherotrites archaeon]|nr:hypothetical protein [Candidatus Diapherotrites archaeon]